MVRGQERGDAMAGSIESGTQREGRRGRVVPWLVAVAAALGAVAGIVAWRIAVSPAPAKARGSRPPEIASPYANARAGVAYVGDEACARCHGEIASTYRRHPMGRSLAPIGEFAAAEPAFDQAADGRTLFEAEGLNYSIERRGGRVFHREAKRNGSGPLVIVNEAEVKYVLGSGNQGASFLIDHDGYLFQSPISWYTRERRWDLSPGYRKSNPHFGRGVVETCLYCHANRVEPVEGTVNRYRPPIFRGHAIGCERCHGPGELHVRRPFGESGKSVDGGRRAGGELDPTIVNPSALEPALRDAVCEQCHLMGQQRVVRLDRRDDDFRPGLPFDAVWTVFVRPSSGSMEKFVGQVEQMHGSRCYRASSGRLGCISCHDPHRRPEESERISFYRGRCLECHGGDRGCALPEPDRRRRQQQDDCTACHMPRLGGSDIAHAAATDHRIPKKPGAAGVDGTREVAHPQGEESRAGEAPLVLFHGEDAEARRRAETARDLGIALCRSGPRWAAAALPLLDAAVAARPDDLLAWQCRGVVLDRLGRPEDGLASFREALARQPALETALAGAAHLADRTRHRAEAIEHLRQAIRVNPWNADYRADLAALCFEERDWDAAIAAGQEAVRLDPLDHATRTLLVRALIRLGETIEARNALNGLIDLDPARHDELMRRFPVLGR
ncbi:MAG: tetratricopeptide repeat protein [Isosphaeraceae bacterium]